MPNLFCPKFKEAVKGFCHIFIDPLQVKITSRNVVKAEPHDNSWLVDTSERNEELMD